MCVREWMQADCGRASFWRGMGDMWGLPWPRDCEFGSAQPVDAAVERSFSRRCTPRAQCVEDLEYRNRLIASSFVACCHAVSLVRPVPNTKIKNGLIAVGGFLD